MLRLVATASRFVAAACACGGSSTPPTTPEPTGGPTEPGPTEPGPTEPGPTEPAVDLAQLGSECGAGNTCASGLACVTYYGIAGPRGPEFKSCELTCGDKGACPTGASCVTIADGPGAVCRVQD